MIVCGSVQRFGCERLQPVLDSEPNGCMLWHCWACDDSLLPGAACVINGEMLFIQICLSPAGADLGRDGGNLAFRMSFVQQFLCNSWYCVYIFAMHSTPNTGKTELRIPASRMTVQDS
jgi:hypothetical protein